MKSTYLKLSLVLAVGAAIGYGASIYICKPLTSALSSEKAASADSVENKPLYWVAPMDPSYKRDKPGKSPMGMDLVPVYGDKSASENGQGDVTVNSALQNNFGVKTETVTQGQIPLTIATMGNVNFNQDLVEHVHPRASGWIEQLNAKAEGQWVNKGDVLYSYYSPDLLTAQQELLTALRSANKRIIAAAKERLTLLGFSEKQLKQLLHSNRAKSVVEVYAKQSGIISKLNVRQGMYLTPATDVLTISGLDSVWIDSQVFEQQADWVDVGQTANITFDGLAGQQFTGKVDFVYPYLNPKSRTVSVRVVLDNLDHQFKPGMFANMTIDAGTTKTGFIIPRQALIKTAQGSHLVLKTDDNHFQSVAVSTGLGNADQVLVLDGLNEGDQLVVSGQFLIDSESNIDASRLRIQSPQKPMPNQVHVDAVVKGVDVDFNSVTLEHQAIDQWKWPSMVMDFDVADDINLNALKEGQAINVTLERDADNNVLLTSIN
ncbi:efflux RND transporter periplasmic adaptor subunit [Paraferrimonas haliotis]|uniref:Hemolysin D n=1 Tax=Paraferrimonas haliotis TaxID=2013866 RepID=A0AA37TP17_9GAMM|nr:efflux RND transporter periplasmic adaptor subunit [Paraferrimonas haliotis]GLS84103.1 hemolysin D [Paraferrimonas haliotis]